jgi:hypothetical protein
MIQKKIKSRPLKFFLLLIPIFILVYYVDKVLIGPLYEYWVKGNIIIPIVFGILFLSLPHFILIYGLLYILFYKIELDSCRIYITTFLGTKIISFEEIRNIYWIEKYATIEGDFQFHVLVIETHHGEQIELGPEWTNRDVLCKYLWERVRRRG